MTPPPPVLPELEVKVHELHGELDRILARISSLEETLAPHGPVQLALDALDARVRDVLATAQLARAHEDRMNNLTLAVAEGISHVDRAEKRVRATVNRARKELRESGVESPGVEAEAAELRLIHGGLGEEEGMPPVPTSVVDPPANLEDPLLTRLRAAGLSR